MHLCQYAVNIPDQVHELTRLFHIQGINIQEFADDVYRTLECVHPKKNCLRLVGKPNSGKTLIAQLLVRNFITAYVNNHNSENEFYLSAFLNKSICICEELMISPATAEDFKSILGGQFLDVAKKYNLKQILLRTPIIVTSQSEQFGRGHISPDDESALALRCYTHKFSTPYTPRVTITVPALAYLIYSNCSLIK